MATGHFSCLGAANSTFIERSLIRNDTPSNQARFAQALFPAYRKRLSKYILKPSTTGL